MVVVETLNVNDGGCLSPERRRKIMSQIRGAGWYRDGTVCGIYPDGLFGGSTGANLSPVLLYYYCFSNGAIRSGCVDSDASCGATLLKPVSAEHHEKKSGFFETVQYEV